MPRVELGTAKQTNANDIGVCVLLIMAEADAAARISDQLGSATERFRVEWVSELSSGIERLRHGGIGAAVLDLSLPDSRGIETSDKLVQAAPGLPVLLLIEADSEEMARQAVQRGAQDYLVKNQANGHRLILAVRTMMDRRASAAVSLENDAAHVTLDFLGEAVLRTDVHANVTYLNRAAEKMTGWARLEALGRPILEVLRLLDAVTGLVASNLVEIISHQEKDTKAGDHSHKVLVRRDGFKREIEKTVALTHDPDGAPTGAVIAFHDASAARAKTLELTHLAEHDALTHLPNRVLFNDRLAQALALAERQGTQLAVMFVDLDHFKRINDSLGHDVGDKLLQSVAARLTACVRRTDTVCRLGGDEFVILLSQIEHEEDAGFSARKVLRSLAAPHIVDNKSLDISASLGGSAYPCDGRDAESLLNKADTAMYEAKQHGRNNYQFFRPDMQARFLERQSLELGLRYALGRSEFLLHYQPKLNLQTGRITGVEALIRWEHPQRGMVYPAQFIPIAEECGLILSIGQWVLLEACKQARAWRDMGIGDVPMAVNVSAAEFGSADFLSGVRAVLIATGVEPGNLELELTESVLMHDAESTIKTLTALKALGVQLAIDDFGTGFSSFSYLQRFPMNVLKLHQSFVHEITEDQKEAPLLTAMIDIGKSLKQRVIAEGVETPAQLEFLERHACNEGQGYYFSPPVGAEHAGKLVHDSIRAALAH
jgi:diguanylate cyclase (GGDEF)-like protein/PAS domain S-box-containing protein